MNKITACVATIAALIGAPAFAADMAVKAPLPAPAPVFSWAGFYIGLNAGGSWSTETTTTSTACPTNGYYCFPSPDPRIAANLVAISADGSGTFHNTEFTGGVQAGYNWQSGNWVLGVEADVESYRAKVSTSVAR